MAGGVGWLSDASAQRLRHQSGVDGRSQEHDLPRGGARSPPAASAPVGEKAAAALADFIVVDMFANVCTGREDAKGAIKIAERQAMRLYR